MYEPNAEAIAREFYAAYAAKDVERLTRTCAEDCIFVTPSLQRMSLSEYTAMLSQQWSGAFTDESIAVLHVLEKGETAVVEWVLRAISKQEIHGLAATGRRHEVPVVTVFEMQGGKVARARIYFNRALFS